MVSYGLRTMWNPESPFHIKPRLNADLIDWGMKFIRSASAEHVEASAPLLRDLHLLSRAEFVALAESLERPFGLVEKGLLMLCRESSTLHEESALAKRALELNVPAEVLTPEEAAKLDPGIRMDVAGAVYFPKDARLSPREFVRAVTDELRSTGVRFIWDAEVCDWRVSGDKVAAAVCRNGESIEGDEFVIAGGSWSPAVVRPLGLRLPMQAGKGYSLTLRDPRRLPQLCSILTEARVAVTPMGNTLRVGGTMEIAGLDLSVNPSRVRGILKSFVRYFPEFTEDDFTGIEPWVGLRPCSPDGLPYIGRVERYENLSLATGHAMMGLSLAPVTGRLVAEMFGRTGESPNPLTWLSPLRFEH